MLLTSSIHRPKPPAVNRLMRGSLNEGAFVHEGLDLWLLENVVGGEYRCQRLISTAVSLQLFLLQMI